jgi:hypothetical protein
MAEQIVEEKKKFYVLYLQFHQKFRDFLGRDILGTTFFRAESSLIQSSCRSFIRVIGPCLFHINMRA